MILRSTNVRAAVKARQRGFLLNPARFGGGGGPTDPDFASVGLLLSMDGSNGGTSFADDSSFAHTVTPSSVVTSAAQARFGTASALISSTGGTANHISVAHDASLEPGASDFTIECWVYFTSVAAASIIVQKALGTGSYPYQLYKTSGNNFGFRGIDNALASAYNLTGTTTVTTGQWYFLQGRRSGLTFALAVDGTQEATTTLGGATTLYSSGTPTAVGNYTTSSTFPVVGYIDELRFSKVARTFTLPTNAFPKS